MSVDFALQVQPIEGMQPVIRIHEGYKEGKAVRGG